MAVVELPYARHTDRGSERLQIIDGVTGERLMHVIEANAVEGWRVEIVVDAFGFRQRTQDGRKWMSQRITGPIRILKFEPDAGQVDLKKRLAAEKRARQAARQAKGMRA